MRTTIVMYGIGAAVGTGLASAIRHRPRKGTPEALEKALKQRARQARRRPGITATSAASSAMDELADGTVETDWKGD